MKKIIILVCGLLITMMAAAQTKHELSVNAFGGLQTLNYKLNNGGKAGMSFGGGGGIGYAYNFSPKWSVASGIDVSLYNGSIEYATFNGVYKWQNSYFEYANTNYKENQSALFLEIPVLARYSINALRFSGGLKFGFPMSAKYTASAEGHTTGDVYIDYDGQTYNFSYLGAQEVSEQSGKFDISTAVQLYLEAAYRLALSEKNGLSFGLYFSYGLNSIQSKNDGDLVTYSTDAADLSGALPKYTYNSSMLNTGNVSSIRPMAIGIKVRFDLGL